MLRRPMSRSALTDPGFALSAAICAGVQIVAASCALSKGLLQLMKYVPLLETVHLYECDAARKEDASSGQPDREFGKAASAGLDVATATVRAVSEG